jgi:hypothetical protein
MNELAVRQTGIVTTFADAVSVATAMAKSGFFQDTKSAEQAIVKVLAGQELGLGPFASMTGIHIIQGRPSMGANLIATLIKNDPRYNYRVTEHTDKVCKITFYEDGKPCGVSEFTADDARKAGTKNMDKYPRNMLFARSISNGARWYTPGIFGGAAVYTPEELGADVDEDGNVIAGTFKDVTPDNGKTPAPVPEVKPKNIPQPVNGGAVTDTAWDMWKSLVEQANALGMDYLEVERDEINIDDLRAEWKALNERVEAAKK